MRSLVSSLSRSVALATILWSSTPASAAVFRVDSELDEVDAAIGDGVCATAAGTCTLRAAVNEANDRDDADTIVLPAGTYALVIPPSDPDWSGAGDLDVRHRLRIRGAGAGVTTIDGGLLDSVFSLNGLGAPGRPRLSVERVTIANGASASGLGGAINGIDAEIELRDATIRDNRALLGGGINLNGGRLTLLRSRVVDNEASGAGGGIRAIGPDARVVLRRSVVAGNRAVLPGNAGGISSGPGTKLELRESEVTENESAQFGGGIVFAGVEAKILRSTLQSNRAGGSGGAIAVFWGDPHPAIGPLAITRSTFTDNVADADTDGSGAGGGISTGEIVPVLRATTVSGNVDHSGRGPDCIGSVAARAGSVIGDPTGCLTMP